MSQSSRAPDAERRFREFYRASYPDLLSFLQRRVGPDHAEDVAAETFLTAWRRFGELPDDTDDARAWAFGIARHLILNARRGHARRQALGVRLAQSTVASPDIEPDFVAARLDLGRAWTRLSEVHQEALALTAFEGLDAPRAAAVLGISPVAFRLRLSRARRALRLHLDHLAGPEPDAEACQKTPTADVATARSPR